MPVPLTVPGPGVGRRDEAAPEGTGDGTVGGMSSSAESPVVTTPRGEPERVLRAFLRSPLEPASWRAMLANVLGFGIAIVAAGVFSACFSTGGALLIWLVGIPIIGLGIECCRFFARVERWRMSLVEPRPLLAHAYRPLNGLPRAPYGAWLQGWAEAEFLDPDRWRDVIYILVLLPLATIEFAIVLGLWVAALSLVSLPLLLWVLEALRGEPLVGIPATVLPALAIVAVPIGLFLVPVAASAARGVMILHRAVVEGLLCVSPTEALRQDVARLRGSRSAALELEASELRRIERDLHDSTQQRLVALAIDLGLAEDRIATDPASATALVASAREQARQALAELRNLVRGTAPAILLDRGLVAALAAVAGGCPVPTVVDSTLAAGERLPPAVERAAYFVVVESLANAAKHGSASRCEVRLAQDGARLIVDVRDDGHGGAVVVPGGGLAGLRDRVQALDGSVEVSSPRGGPTLVHVELPLGPETGASGADTAAWIGP